MIWVDYAILFIIAVSVLISLVRGFVREALSLVSWVVAFWIAMRFSHVAADYLTPHIEVPSMRMAAGFLLLFIVSLLIGAVINYLAGQLVNKTGFSGTDRMFGVLFGIARGGLIVAVLVLLAGLTPFPKDPWWHESVLLGHFQSMALWMRGLLPPDYAAYFVYD